MMEEFFLDMVISLNVLFYFIKIGLVKILDIYESLEWMVEVEIFVYSWERIILGIWDCSLGIVILGIIEWYLEMLKVVIWDFKENLRKMIIMN